MNPFEEFLRRLFGSGPPPTVIEEERQAANMGRVAQTMPEMARSLGQSVLQAYRDRNAELMDVARRQVLPGTNVPLSDFGGVPQGTAQRDLALDVLSAGLAPGMRVGTDLLSSAPAVGGSVARNAALDRLSQNPIFQIPENPLRKLAPDSWKQFGNTIEEARVNLSRILSEAPLRPEVAGAPQQIPVGHSSPYFYTQPEISRGTAKTGEGAALMGPGLYIAESPDVFKSHYRETLARPTGPNTILGGQLPIDFDAIRREYRITDDALDDLKGIKKRDELFRRRDVLNDLSRRVPRQQDVEATKSRIDYLRSSSDFSYNRLSEYQEKLNQAKDFLGRDGANKYLATQAPLVQDYFLRHPEDFNKRLDVVRSNAQRDLERYTGYIQEEKKYLRETLKEFNKEQSKLTKNLNIKYPEKVIATYEGVLGASPNELLQLDLPFYGLQGNDLERVMQALGNFKTSSGSSLADEYIKNMREAARNLPQMSPMTLEELQSTSNKGLRDRLRQAAKDVQNINVNPLKGYSPTYRYSSLQNDPFAIVEAMRDQGFVGTKYADALTRRNFLANIVDPEPSTFNYTVFDPRRLQFTQAYAAANPFSPLGTAMQAIQNEQEKKKNAKNPGSRAKP